MPIRRSARVQDLSGSMVKASGKQSLITGFLKPVDPGASAMITKALIENSKKKAEEKKPEDKKSDETPKRKRKAKEPVVSVNA
jgi:hypothetical protein